MLWRRYQPKAEVAGKAKERQKAHEANRIGGSAAKSISCGVEAGLTQRVHTIGYQTVEKYPKYAIVATKSAMYFCIVRIYKFVNHNCVTD